MKRSRPDEQSSGVDYSSASTLEYNQEIRPENEDPAITFDGLNADLLSNILSYLSWKELLQSRVCKSIKNASIVTTIEDPLVVSTSHIGNCFDKIAAALPMIENVVLNTINFPYYKLYASDLFQRLPCYRHIRHLEIIFDSQEFYELPREIFSLSSLQSIVVEIGHGYDIADDDCFLLCDIKEFARLRKLRKIKVKGYQGFQGDLESLRDLKDVLEELSLERCRRITGSLMSLSDFLSLRVVYLEDCKGITGDIHDIKPNNFPALTNLELLHTQIFGSFNFFETIDEVDIFYRAWREVLKHPRPFSSKCRVRTKAFVNKLSQSSLMAYKIPRHVIPVRGPPFWTELVWAGSRVGYRWTNLSMACDTIWIDPKLYHEGEGYEEYQVALSQLEEVHKYSIYRGHSIPPTEEEWRQIARV